MSFSERLKEARISLGYTQQQVADEMGITNSTYCGYETGKRQPDVVKIKKLAAILKVSGDYLLETGFDAINTEGTDEIEQKLRGSQAAELILCYQRLDDGHQAVVNRMVQELLKLQEKAEHSDDGQL